jgi:dipeptidyl aminopeptidase/acylaminoacyl peptidase
MPTQTSSLATMAVPFDAGAPTAPAAAGPDGPSRVTFSSGGEACVGHLRLPSGAQAPVPCVVLATGFSGTQDTPSLLAAADAFVEAGFGSLRFDYRHFGERGGQPRQLIVIEEQLADIAAAVGFARSHPGIDPSRVALWGASLGGGHVVVAASRDPRIAAVVAQSPFNGFPKKVEGRSTASTLRLLGAMTWDAVRGMLGLSPACIPVVGAD